MATGWTNRVAIEAAEIARNSRGEVLQASYEVLDGLDEVWAIIVPTVDERRQERFAEDNDTWQIVLAGDWPQVRQNHYVRDLDTDQRYEVQRVSTTKRGRVTTMLARLGSITGPGATPGAA